MEELLNDGKLSEEDKRTQLLSRIGSWKEEIDIQFRETEYLENKPQPKSVKDSKQFFSSIDRHFECMENEDYRSRTDKYDNGRKLYLEVEVVGSEMTPWLHQWLYCVDENKENLIPFGLKLEKIWFNVPAMDIFRNKLIEFANTLE